MYILYEESNVFHMYFQWLTPLLAEAHIKLTCPTSYFWFLTVAESLAFYRTACYFKVAYDKAWSSLAIHLLHKCGFFFVPLRIFLVRFGVDLCDVCVFFCAFSYTVVFNLVQVTEWSPLRK